MLSHVLTFFNGDQQVIEDYLNSFREKAPAELVNLYNKQQKCGITGVHRQGLYLYAMHRIFLEKFNESPINLDDSVLEFTKPIELKDGKFRIIDRNKNPFSEKDRSDPSTLRELDECKTVQFVSQPVLSFLFFCLVVRIDSIYTLHGDPVTFIEEYFPWGTMNKDILAFVSMSFPGQEIGRIIEEVLKPLGFEYDEDYAVLQEDQPPQYNEEKANLVFLPNISSRDILWLGSVVTDAGNFIWFRK